MSRQTGAIVDRGGVAVVGCPNAKANILSSVRRYGRLEVPELTELEKALLSACKVALRQLEYDGDDKTAFTGFAFGALTEAIAKAEERAAEPH